jgi:hypothetical protein
MSDQRSRNFPVRMSTVLEGAGPIARQVIEPDGICVRPLSWMRLVGSGILRAFRSSSNNRPRSVTLSAILVCPSLIHPSYQMRNFVLASSAACTAA